ncbi:MAG: asparagine synthase (glutamine-hydrolyzing) [Deltaproteobacteria bacterium]|nr:asparagine synthase (glutamine-hydrolyzing) [Deltaproteobacteria bacterium]
MCGICGFTFRTRPDFEPDAVLERMKDRLRHRGPDGEGSWAGEGVRLGHRRLNIVDLEGGAQPMANEDGMVITSFNGELYNHLDLRGGLEARGHRFRTRSDTEALVHLWEEKGVDTPAELRGMFAISLWDERQGCLFLARDRLGKKPLYWARTREGLAFGSELTALLEHPGVGRDLDPVSLRRYLLFDAVPAPGSILRGVHKLEPGTWLLWTRDSGLRLGRYWDLTFPPRDQRPPPVPEAARTLRQLLSDSVRARLMSDVPLGVFLSGGIDSSAVVAAMRDHREGPAIQSFSIGFEDPSFDETVHAATVARHFGTTHRHKTLTPRTMLDKLPGIMARLDEPLADGSLIPVYLLSEFTREHVTVALGGDGGDELNLGYPTFQAHRIAAWLGWLPRPLRAALTAAVDRLPVSHANISFDYKARQLMKGLAYHPSHRHFVWIGALPPPEQRPLLHGDVLAAAPDEEVFAVVDRHAGACAPRDSYDLLTYLYAKLYMCDDILCKVDRASMMHGLEARAPFLDTPLVEFLAGLPTSYKLRGMTMKYLLRRAFARDLPREILARPKKGFGVPIARWLRGELRSWAGDLLHADGHLTALGLEPAGVRDLFHQHQAGVRDHRKALWSVIVLLLWYDRNLR